MAAACRRALGESEGSLLAFLPGVAEIERTAERLDRLPADVDLHRLHGSLDPAAQRAAIAAPPPGRRKLVLATSIAETSLTLDGVRIVVDSGLARRPRYDRAAGLTRLVTERASQAAVTQRAGRAGRQAAGPRLPAVGGSGDAEPAALRSAGDPGGGPVGAAARLRDLGRRRSARPALARSAAGRRDRRRRASACSSLGAIGEDGRPTAHGRAIAALPLPPRLAHMLIEADARGWGETAAEAAVLISERGLGGTDADLEVRLRRWRSEKGKRADAARGLARRWLGLLPAAARRQGRAGPLHRPRLPRPRCRDAAAATAPTG